MLSQIAEDMLSQPAAPNRPYTECPEIPELQKQVQKVIRNFTRKVIGKEMRNSRILLKGWFQLNPWNNN